MSTLPSVIDHTSLGTEALSQFSIPSPTHRQETAMRKAQTFEVGYQTRILTGTADPCLAQDVASHLGLNITPCRVHRFANGEIDIKICENIRGDDVFILQSAANVPHIVDVNTAVMELLLLIHTARLASAKRITAVLPYYPYARQDRKTQSRVPISASVIAQLIQSMGVDRIITLDLHCGQIQGFFRNLPLDNLSIGYPFVCFLQEILPDLTPSRTVIVSPDASGVERATLVADLLMASHVVTILRRQIVDGMTADNCETSCVQNEQNGVDTARTREKSFVMQAVGEVEGYHCIIMDDMIDTGSRLVAAANTLQSLGAMHIVACATHGILTDPACARIMSCDALEMVCVTDGIPQKHNITRCSKLKILSVAPLLAQAIDRVHEEKSLSAMFHTSKCIPTDNVPTDTMKSISPGQGAVYVEKDQNSSHKV